jgi:biotin operon repressor
MTAAEIAARLGISGNHETQRRHIRAIVKELRDNHGSMIVANTRDGYWLTTDVTIWQDYNNHIAIDAKVMLAEVGNRKKMLAGKKGQGMLFDNRVPAGYATIGANNG